MTEESGEVEDGLIDLNKEPVERKRKRVEKNNPTEKGDLQSNGLPTTGRVLRSRTVAMSDGEKQVIKLEIVKLDDKDDNEVSVMEHKDENKVPVLKKKKKKDGRGRPRKNDGEKHVTEMEIVHDNEVSMMEYKDESNVPVLNKMKKKDGRGRPRKNNGEKQVVEMEIVHDNEVSMMENKDESKVPVLNKMKKKDGRGRPPKNGREKQVTEMEIVHDNEVSMMEYKDERKVPVLNKMKKKGRRGRPPKNDGEKQVTKMEILHDNEVPMIEHKDESKVSILNKKKKKDGRGRPPKNGGKCEVSVSYREKGRRGRPPKMEGQCEASSLSCRKKDDKVMECKKVDDSNNRAGRDRGRSEVKRKLGRPRKLDNENAGLVIKKKIVKINSDNRKSGDGSPLKRLKIDGNDLENGVMRPKKGTAEHAEGKEMGLREQKQLLRDQIVAMLNKAGWTVEYRQRLSKDYQDAVYVDREGRTYWSVTLAYKMLKKRIDDGQAEEKDVLAFSPIPEETLSILYRITEKGRKKGKKKNGAGKTIKKMTKKESSKTKPLGGRIKSRLNRGSQRTLLARKPRDGSDSDDYELYEGKRSLLSWMIDLGTVPLGGKVRYKKGRKQKILLEGRIMKDGICCDCCNITHRILDFELHAKSTLGKPYENIYLDSGNSLFQCLENSWKKHVETDNIGFVTVNVEGDDPNDDTCNICGDGGDLICCDSCPSTFHHGCLRIKVPSGDWHCVYCSCKFCGMNCGSTSTTDDDHNILSELFTCRLCQGKFHSCCIKGEETAEDFNNENPFFCGKECLKIFEQLKVLLGVRHELQEEFSYTVLQHRGGDASLNDDSSMLESNSKLAIAFSVMDECFQPIIDERSGTNMIHNVVYSCGSNIRRLNYDGFHTIILEKGDELVAAASIRIHGSQLAEMPFIGTRFMYRRQGMCSRLLTAIEMVLCSLGVEKLVIPAISELNETWTKVFGFVPLEESKRQEMKYMSMIVFPGINMLQKPLVGLESIEGKMDSAAKDCTEVGPEHQIMQETLASDASIIESTEVQTHHRNTGEEHGDNTGVADAPIFDISTEVEIQGNDEMTAMECGATLPVSSLNKANTEIGGESSDGDVDTSKDNNLSLKTNISIDCNLEAQQSVEETNTCPNGFLSENGKPVEFSP